jgi:hypothetical protein
MKAVECQSHVDFNAILGENKENKKTQSNFI